MHSRFHCMVKSMSETNAGKRQQSITHFKRETVLLTFLYQEKGRTEFEVRVFQLMLPLQ